MKEAAEQKAHEDNDMFREASTKIQQELNKANSFGSPEGI